MRKHYIDNLRWIILLILIPYHTAQAWNVWGEPNYIILGQNRWISSITVFFSPYFMPILFLLAGISTRYSLEKRTMKQYLLERGKRLLAPFLFGTIVLMPIMSYIADKFNCFYRGGFLEHYRVFFTTYTDLTGADGGFSVGQFWFLLYLFIISCVSMVIVTFVNVISQKAKKRIPFWLVILMGIPLPLFHDLLSIGGKSLVEYTYFFLVGYYVFTDETIIDTIEKRSGVLFGIGFLATILNVYLFIWMDADYPLLNDVTNYVAKWIMTIALLGMAKKYLNNDGRIANYMRVRSFLFYVYHYVWVVLFQWLLYEELGNYTVILYFGTVICAYLMTFVCCEISIRQRFLCFVLGTRKVN